MEQYRQSVKGAHLGTARRRTGAWGVRCRKRRRKSVPCWFARLFHLNLMKASRRRKDARHGQIDNTIEGRAVLASDRCRGFFATLGFPDPAVLGVAGLRRVLVFLFESGEFV